MNQQPLTYDDLTAVTRGLLLLLEREQAQQPQQEAEEDAISLLSEIKEDDEVDNHSLQQENADLRNKIDELTQEVNRLRLNLHRQRRQKQNERYKRPDDYAQRNLRNWQVLRWEPDAKNWVEAIWNKDSEHFIVTSSYEDTSRTEPDLSEVALYYFRNPRWNIHKRPNGWRVFKTVDGKSIERLDRPRRIRGSK